MSLPVADGDEPTAADLAAIEREWPLIAAELDLLDAEISLLGLSGFVSAMDHRRVRRAKRRVLAVERQLDAGAEAADIDGAEVA
ncbi:DUF6284 family protein [Kribbella catacumbae]|uniref:DUF6284 family protein n=1 Tax=Kribbella catacumbae TaxID=460086 RepID=UPI000A01126A|nr:DUF6284 family protein [Kribbella catacumbae]